MERCFVENKHNLYLSVYPLAVLLKIVLIIKEGLLKYLVSNPEVVV